MPVYLKFRRLADNRLSLYDTEEAKSVAKRKTGWSPATSHKHVEKEARDRVIARNGDVGDEKDVLGQYI